MKIVTLLSVVASITLVAAPAKAGFKAAGFQWVAPNEPAVSSASPNYPGNSMAAPAPSSMPPAPTVPVQSSSMSVTRLTGESPEIISPIVIEGQQPMPSSPQPAPALQPQPVSLGSMPSLSAPDSTVQGFANNVPLAVALRQILPPGYGFSIDQDVDLGTLVSFDGGKTWRETLQTMLSPAGLEMREQNQMIAIGRSHSAVTPVAAGGEMSGGMVGSPPPPTPLAPTPINPPMQQKVDVVGPRPTWTQPNVNIPQPVSKPLVSSSRISSNSVIDTWTAERGKTLHKTLQEWSRRSGTEFEWLAEYDYPMQASISFTGTFEEAVRSLLSGFEDAHPQPVAELHANPGAGQMVLVIQTRGNSYAD